MQRRPDRATVLLPVVVLVPLVALEPIAVAIVIAGGSGSAAEPTPVESCTTIDEPGEYELVADIVDDMHTRLSQACLEITADEVALDGGGHLVDGKGISDTTGVHVRNASDVVVRDLRVTNWNRGVHLDGVTGGAVVDLHATLNARGLDVERSRDVAVEGGNISANLIGVDLNGENGNVTVADGVAAGNHVVDVYRTTEGATRRPAANATERASRPRPRLVATR